MKLLTQTLPQVRQLIHQGGWFSPVLVISLCALEFFGRKSANDFYDTLGAATLVLMVALVAIRHRLAPLNWVGYLGRQVKKLARFTDRFKIEFGPDLRGKPPIPRKLPSPILLTMVLMIVWSAVAVTLWYNLPNSWRSYVIQGSYILYLVGMLALWGLLFTGALGGIYFPFMLFNYLYPRTTTGSAETKMSRGQLTFLTTYVLTVALASWLLPLWVVLAFSGCVIVAVTLLALWPRKPDVQFIWRAVGSARVWSITTPRLLWVTTVVVTLLLTALVLTATGSRVLGIYGIDADMPITVMLGAAVAWLTPGILITAGIFVFLLWKHNPSRNCEPSIHIEGVLATAARPQIKQAFKIMGWNLKFEPQSTDRIDVRIRLVEQMHSQAQEFDPSWPLCLSLEDLQLPTVIERLKRRDEIQKRRLLLRGVEKIFKHTVGRTFSGGTGYWLAPHLWFMPGLARDEIDDDRDDSALLAQTVGPPFQDVMHRHVRQYLYHLLRALEVDLIFIEDGVSFRKLKRALRIMFEVFDKSAGTKRAEETHFLGLPKIKVLIHDFQLDEPFRSETYPEPRFEDLGRARILHIFRDRGDQEEYMEPPFDFGRTPVPLYV